MSTTRVRAAGPAVRTASTGSRTQIATAIAVTTSSPAIAQRAARDPPCAASVGRVAAASAVPIGTALCRMAIANPRPRVGNQVSTTRPLAELMPETAAPASPK